MSLTLPADLEPFVGTTWTTPAVYCLRLELPRDLPRVWDELKDHRPEYVDRATTAREVLYVGAAKNVLARLEDHRDGDYRKVALVSCADDIHLRNVWPFDDPTRAFERESQFALTLANETDETTYVHQR